MSGFWYLVLGLLVGWLIELAIDFVYWRRRGMVMEKRFAERDRQLAAEEKELQNRRDGLTDREAELSSEHAALNARTAELASLGQRIEERCEALDRLEAAFEARRSELDRHSALLNERDKELTERQRSLKRDEAALNERSARSAEQDADLGRRLTAVTNREIATTGWEERLNQREQELVEREQDIRIHTESVKRLRDDHAGLMELMDRRVCNEDGTDDLTEIFGVTPDTAIWLAASGIDSFRRLAETPIGELSRLLEAAGDEIALADPMTWPEQSALLVERNYVAFQRRVDRLREQYQRDQAVLAESGRAHGRGPMHSSAPQGAGRNMQQEVRAMTSGRQDAGYLQQPQPVGSHGGSPGRGEDGSELVEYAHGTLHPSDRR